MTGERRRGCLRAGDGGPSRNADRPILTPAIVVAAGTALRGRTTGLRSGRTQASAEFIKRAPGDRFGGSCYVRIGSDRGRPTSLAPHQASLLSPCGHRRRCAWTSLLSQRL